ncbi:MAG: class I SAM-dependent methyltransferase [Betaproteobacteria bacterium]
MLMADARILYRLLRGQQRKGSHAERLAEFYGPQAVDYDRSREALLHGRRELIELLEPPAGATVVELGGGTGRNVAFFRERLPFLKRVDVVDLCRPLLEQARRRAEDWPNVRVIEADATAYAPEQPVDAVYFSYSLSMIPDWFRAIDNALAMLKPGGLIGVVDFYVSRRDPAPGCVRHGALARSFWRAWFDRDGVFPNPDHLPFLMARCQTEVMMERAGPVPGLPFVRVPYYLFIGRKRRPVRAVMA